MTRRRLLAAFFIFMLGCTVISRIYDSVTVPKVKTAAAKRKGVEIRAEGVGTVIVKEKEFCDIYPQLRVRRTAVIPGSEVKEGDVLFWYDMESILEKKEEIQTQIERLNIDIEKEQLSQESSQGLTQEETARWELSLAQRELAEGEAEYEETVADHQKELERLRTEYEQGLELAEDELWQQQERDQESARQALESVKASRDDALRGQRRVIEDLEEELERLSDSEEAEGERERLERRISRAQEDLKSMTASWEEQVDSARYQIDLLDYQEARILKGQTTVQEARKENYEEAVRQEENKLKEAGKSLEELRKAVERLAWQAEAARRSDSADQMSQERSRKISQLTVRSLELDKKELEKQLAALEELETADGQVRAPADGTVVDMEVEEGKTSTGQELLSLTAGGAWFEGTFQKEEQKLAVGDTIEITVPGTAQPAEAVISRMNLLGDQEGIFQADLEDKRLRLGTVTRYSSSSQSDVFAKVIPLTGLRKDMKGWYCLVARPVDTILGQEFRARRVDVEVLLQGNEEAAVDGAIFETDQVIVGENKAIGEDSRVRPGA